MTICSMIPIQGQSQGHETLKVKNSAIFKGYLLPQFIIGLEMTTGSYISGQYLKLNGAGFFILS